VCSSDPKGKDNIHRAYNPENIMNLDSIKKISINELQITK